MVAPNPEPLYPSGRPTGTSCLSVLDHPNSGSWYYLGNEPAYERPLFLTCKLWFSNKQEILKRRVITKILKKKISLCKAQSIYVRQNKDNYQIKLDRNTFKIILNKKAKFTDGDYVKVY